jgi:hypothetical protein
MEIEVFARKIMSSGILNIYIAAGFFATLIFFILNSHMFTPLEMTFGTIIITIALKGVSNIMLSLIILLFDLEDNQSEHKFRLAEEKLDLLINEMKMQEATMKSVKVNNN